MATSLFARRLCGRRNSHAPHALALAAWALSGAALAQSAEQITVVGRTAAAPTGVSGFDTPPEQTPLQTTTLTQTALQDSGVAALGGITRLDASVSDAYNAPGYWASVSVRGYGLDNRFNFRRDGLPISGETALPLFNKERVELLKGLSGLQAGTSAPGGLVNLVVKRPRGDSTTLQASLSDGGSVAVSADIDRRLADGDAGLRLNLEAEHLDPLIHDAQGHRWGAALAGSARVTPDSRLDAEVELNRQVQPSVPGLSLLGAQLPSAGSISPRTNLNNQPWSQPVVFAGTTASLRWTQTLDAQWKAVAHAMTQRLRTDDRLAYPYGCSAEGLWDRYCSDGSFDVYDFRSDGEHRTSDALQLALEGQADTLGVRHSLSLGALGSRYHTDLPDRVDDAVVVGTGSVWGTLPPIDTLPALGTTPNTNRNERSTELFVRDHAQLSPELALWLGLRHSALHRQSVRSDGSNPTDYRQSFTTPWLAGTWQLSARDMVYASWGEGVESSVVPNKAAYGAQAGKALPAQISRQTEIGLKHTQAELSWALTAFDIHRPYVEDTGSELRFDGQARHQGVEASAEWRDGPWTAQGSVTALHARRQGSASAATNGLTPTNVPSRSARLGLSRQMDAVPGLSLGMQLSHEGPREVLPDNSLTLPSWTTVGLNARYAWRSGQHEWLLRAGVDNLFDRRAWQESPYQYGHAYLYPLQGRAWRLSAQVSL